MNNFYLYRHIRPDKNEPFYIGIGKCSKTYNRTRDKRRNSLWKNIVRKLNNDFTIEIMITDLTLEEALEKEKEFILLYGKIIDGTGTLANILDFGCGSKKGLMSDCEKEQLRKRMINNQFAKGYKMSVEQKEHRSSISKNQKNNKNKKWSCEVRKKMSISHLANTATKGYKHITDGNINKRIPAHFKLPEGYKYGRTINKNQYSINNIN